jgi:hypothetical protein
MVSPQNDPALRLVTEGTAAARFGTTTPGYRKRVIHNLPFKYPDYDAAKAFWGDHYPQTFAVDPLTDELFVVFATDTKQIVAIYTWSTGVYKQSFAYDCTVVSEGAVIKRESSTRYLYVRTGSNTLSRFNITILPPNLTTVTAANNYANTAAGVNFTYANGFWTANDNMPPIGNSVESRGFMKRMDDNFTVVGQMQFSESLSGGNSAGYRDNSLPKMQGFIEAGGKFILAIGGYHKAGDTVTPYGYQGIRVLSGQGQLLEEALLRPDLMINILQQHGYNPTRVECEGIVSVGNSLYSLTVTSSYNAVTDPVGADNGGLLIMEEFSTHKDAIDFSSAAVTWTQTPAERLQVGLFPRGADGKMHNPITNEVMDTLDKILVFMKLSGQSLFRFYSSSATVTDTLGVAIPSGMFVEIINTNNSTYQVRSTGTSGYPALLRITPNGAGWTQTNINDTGFRAIGTGLSSAWTAASAEDVLLRRNGNVVHFSAKIDSTAATGDTVLTLPSGFRPKAADWLGITAYNSAGGGRWGRISSAGVLSLSRLAPAGAHYLAGTWLTPDAWPGTYPGTEAL